MTAPRRTIYVNGKFTAQPTTGVQRAAANLVMALDRLLAYAPAPADAPRWVLLCPRGSEPMALTCIEVKVLGGTSAGLKLWEQLALPFAARRGVLLNFAGSAPLCQPRQVVTFHDAAIYDHPEAYTRSFVQWYRLLFWWLARHALLVLTVSEFSRTRLQASLRLKLSAMRVLTWGAGHFAELTADESLLTLPALQGRPFFLAVGSANRTKNLQALVQAFAGELRGLDVALVIVGGRNQAVFNDEALGPAAATDTRIIMVGRVSDEQLKSLYQHALAFVFPSLYEGFGLPPLEAMACGCPVLASNTASMPEVCGDAALYFDPASTQQMGAAMRRMLDEPALRQQLRLRGAERVKRFTWDAAAAQLMAHLQEAGLLGAARP
jgi:glycosyltransferase involved in cell wall biosynthesis